MYHEAPRLPCKMNRKQKAPVQTFGTTSAQRLRHRSYRRNPESPFQQSVKPTSLTTLGQGYFSTIPQAPSGPSLCPCVSLKLRPSVTSITDCILDRPCTKFQPPDASSSASRASGMSRMTALALTGVTGGRQARTQASLTSGRLFGYRYTLHFASKCHFLRRPC